MGTLPLNKHIAWRGVSTPSLLNNYAGVDREVVVDMTKHTLVLCSGTAGTNYRMAREDVTLTPTSGKGVVFKKSGTAVNSATLAEDFSVEVNAADLYEANGGIGVDGTSGKLKADFSLSYTAATGVFKVLGANGTTELATVTLPTHLSVLKSVTLETASAGSPVNSQVSGTFIHFVFTLSSGTDSDIYLNVTDLIDIYTAGDGLALSNGQFSASLGNGLQINSTSKAIEAKIKSGETILVSDSNGLSIDTSALTTATNQTIVSATSGNIISADATDGGAYLALASDSGLELDSNGKLQLVMDFGTVTE